MEFRSSAVKAAAPDACRRAPSCRKLLRADPRPDGVAGTTTTTTFPTRSRTRPRPAVRQPRHSDEHVHRGWPRDRERLRPDDRPGGAVRPMRRWRTTRRSSSISRSTGGRTWCASTTAGASQSTCATCTTLRPDRAARHVHRRGDADDSDQPRAARLRHPAHVDRPENLFNDFKATASWNGQRIPPAGDNWMRDTYGFQFPQVLDRGRYDVEGIPRLVQRHAAAQIVARRRRCCRRRPTSRSRTT